MKEIPKKNSFKTPPGYFEGLSDRILNKLDEEDKAVMPEQEGFKVPDGYFEKVEKEVLEKTVQKEARVIPLRGYKTYFYAAAAIAVLFVLVIGLVRNTDPDLSFDDLAQAEITRYIESRDLGLSSYEIAEVLPVTDLEIGDFVESGVENQEILDYLEDTIDDLEELNIDTHEEFQ